MTRGGAQRRSKPRSILAEAPGLGRAANAAQKAVERRPEPVRNRRDTRRLLLAYVLVHTEGRTIPATDLRTARRWLDKHDKRGLITQRGKVLYKR